MMKVQSHDDGWSEGYRIGYLRGQQAAIPVALGVPRTVTVQDEVPTNDSDLVNHPPHYQGHPKGIECIEVIEDMPHPNLANVVKYAWRVAFGGKWDDIEDLKKIVWYANREIERRAKA